MSVNHGRKRGPSKEIVLFVEGSDEVNVFSAILNRLAIHDVDVLDVGGKDNLPNGFESAVKHAGFGKVRSFAIFQDADEDAAGALARVRAVLSSHNFLAPKASGEVVESGDRKIGVLILPGENRSGCLESLFLDSQIGTPLEGCVNSFAACTTGLGVSPLKAKQLTHVYLAALDAPEPRLGRAFESGKITGDHAAFDVVRDFIKLLM